MSVESNECQNESSLLEALREWSSIWYVVYLRTNSTLTFIIDCTVKSGVIQYSETPPQRDSHKEILPIKRSSFHPKKKV